jgi:hypothetical protein
VGEEIKTKTRAARYAAPGFAGWHRLRQSATDAFSLRHARLSATPTEQRDAEDPRDLQDSKDSKMMRRETRFGSLEHYDKGGVEVINDDPRNYAFDCARRLASLRMTVFNQRSEVKKYAVAEQAIHRG